MATRLDGTRRGIPFDSGLAATRRIHGAFEGWVEAGAIIPEELQEPSIPFEGRRVTIAIATLMIEGGMDVASLERFDGKFAIP
jgi:hypothetical protein